MKITIPVACSSCGYEFPVAGYGEKKFPLSRCPKCNAAINIFDPLSISVFAERLLHRSKREMEGGDYTLSIICSAMAVECFLTQAFLKWKEIESYKSTGHLTTEDERDAWEQEYRKKSGNGGFLKSADFVSEFLSGIKFDDFATTDFRAKAIMVGLSGAVGLSPKEYFQQGLFKKRNRILHWGEVNYQQTDAALCWGAAVGVIGILKVMDADKCQKMERYWRQSLI
jgi:hypothetical protein